jgi:hypothetical protein
MNEMKHKFPNLVENIEHFDGFADNIFREYMRLDDASSDSSVVWEVLNLQKVMDDCIKSGQYDSAYGLSTFASNLQQSKLSESPIIRVCFLKRYFNNIFVIESFDFLDRS